MAEIDIQKVAREVMKAGPDRVVTNVRGDATTSRAARERFGINPDVIFIRDDGWTLGAPSRLEATARRLWQGHWVGILRKPETVAKPLPRNQEKEDT